MAAISNDLTRYFRENFGSLRNAIGVRSPGRVNLIGEHTDYNEGFVLPAAVDKAVTFVIAPRTDGALQFHAADLSDTYSGSVDAIARSDKGWPNYLLGIVAELQKSGHVIPGCNVVFGGDVPIGAGMSSSAAIECGFAFALSELFHLGLGKLELAKLGQKAEHNFVGVHCGIMDQFVNIFGSERKVLKIDCRSLEFEYFPFERSDLNIVLCETESKRSLASSEYNIRRQQCEAGVAVLQKHDSKIRSLRDATEEHLVSHRDELDAVVFRRCLHVVRENARVLKSCGALQQDDYHAFGQNMVRSHESLRDDYEVSSSDLDFLVDAALCINGILGARMMGAGFGGCTINLVEQRHVSAFADEIKEQYRRRTGKANNVYVTQIQTGTELVPLG
jgi:galactokinase